MLGPHFDLCRIFVEKVLQQKQEAFNFLFKTFNESVIVSKNGTAKKAE